MAKSEGFSEQERAAMKARAAELKTQGRAGKAAAKAEEAKAALLDKIAEMPDSDRVMAERLHSVVAEVAPDLAPKLYYGQPGYARDGKVVVFFRSGQMDKERYSTLGFSAEANLDTADGLWPTAYALIDPTDTVWEEVAELIKQAVS